MLINKFVVVRTRSAGVHMGWLMEYEGTCTLLRNARRLWSWNGAFSLHEVSLHGVAENSRISEPVEIISLSESIEVIPCTPQAIENLTRSRNGT